MKNVSITSRKTTNGFRYQYRFDGAVVNGKRKQISKSGFLRKRDAEIAGKKAYEDYYNSSIKSPVNISLNDFILYEWFPERARIRLWQKTTRDGYMKKIKNYILPHLGFYQLSSVPSSEIEKMLNTLYYPNKGPGLCYQSISDIHSILHSIFKYALSKRYISISPMTSVEVPKRKENEIDGVASENKQSRAIIPSKIMESIFKKFPEGTSPYIPMKTSLLTGMRLGEAFGLSWEDIDFKNNLIHINRQMQEDKETYISNPKYNSKRVVPLCLELKKILLKEKKKQEKNKKELKNCYRSVFLLKDESSNGKKHNVFYLSNKTGDSEIHLVNVRADGQFISPSIMKYTSRIIHGYSSNKKLKNKITSDTTDITFVFPNFNMHSLRHTYASSLRNKGISETIISELLGHKGLYITENYLHNSEADYKNVKKVLDSKFHSSSDMLND